MKNTRKIDKIIIHCSATPEGRSVTVADIDRWHRQSGFNGIGYHYVVGLDGTIAKGRDEQVAGAHCSGHNASSVGVCYVGGCDRDMKPKDTRTPRQREALQTVVAQLLRRYPQARVYGHNQLTCRRGKTKPGFDCLICRDDCSQCCYAAKACPSFNVKSEF